MQSFSLLQVIRRKRHDSETNYIADAAKELLREGFILEEDAQVIIDAAAASTIGN